MKKWMWIALAALVLFFGGFIVRSALDNSHFKPGGVDNTNSVSGNTVLKITNFVEMTNSVTNLITVWNGFHELALDPFQFVQKNDKMTVNLAVGTEWMRSASTKIYQWRTFEGWMFGVGAEYYSAQIAPAALVGYHFEYFAFLATVAISTNFNAGAFLLWMP